MGGDLRGVSASLLIRLTTNVPTARLYYQNNPARLSTCVVTVHALLHIADSIVAMGPVGAYWSFVMERFCSSLRPAIRSRKYPYTSIDHYVTDAAKINQVRLAHDLDDYFNRRSANPASLLRRGEFFSPQCKFSQLVVFQRSSTYKLLDPSSALMPPRILDYELTPLQRRKIARHLSVRFQTNAAAVLPLVPTHLAAWGKVRRLDGGDTIHSQRIGIHRHDGRDATYVRVRLAFPYYSSG